MLWRDLLIAALRPVIRDRSFAASSMAPFSREALTPMLTTIFFHARHLVRVAVFMLLAEGGRHFLSVFVVKSGFHFAISRILPERLWSIIKI
jgi:hypothetical protein